MNTKTLLLSFCFSFAAIIANAGNGIHNNGSQTDMAGGVVDADSKKPLNNVSVIVVSHDTKEKKVAVTDGAGNYSFSNMKAGNYKVVFQKDGFRKVIKEKVYIKEDENFQLNVELSSAEDFQLIPGILLFE
jgi:hypothetical protein